MKAAGKTFGAGVVEVVQSHLLFGDVRHHPRVPRVVPDVLFLLPFPTLKHWKLGFICTHISDVLSIMYWVQLCAWGTWEDSNSFLSHLDDYKSELREQLPLIAGSAAAGVVFVVSLVAISIVCSR